MSAEVCLQGTLIGTYVAWGYVKRYEMLEILQQKNKVRMYVLAWTEGCHNKICLLNKLKKKIVVDFCFGPD